MTETTAIAPQTPGKTLEPQPGPPLPWEIEGFDLADGGERVAAFYRNGWSICSAHLGALQTDILNAQEEAARINAAADR